MRTCLGSIVLVISATILTSCGGGSGGGGGNPPPPANREPDSDQENSPESCLPDLSIYNADPNKPSISLLGAKVELLEIGDTYIDSGATATDTKDGDISSNIDVYGLENINTNIAGDYLIRYEVSDSDQNEAFPVYRFVRIQDDEAVNESRRFFSEVDAVWEYMEHLPTDFGVDADAQYPLLIVNHGWSSSKRFDSSGTMAGMDVHSMIEELRVNNFLENLPFIVLTPQRCWSDFGPAQTEMLNSFVEWGKRNYPVDENRVYMTGLSMGGWATWEYVRNYPNTLAAAAPISGGGYSDQICSAAPTPIWAFTARNDTTVPPEDVISTVEALAACENLAEGSPKLTVFSVGGHVIDDNVFNLSYLNLGESAYDLYDQSIFDWFLEHELN